MPDPSTQDPQGGHGEARCTGPCRRSVLVGAGAVGVGAAVAACGSSPSQAVGSASSAVSGAVGKAISKASIPVGGGRVFPDQKVVVTQPTAGDFKAFSAVCTHQGCIVGDVSGGSIECPCHGSRFDIATGAVKRGPATQPLPAKTVTVGAQGITLS
jgi:Rieske Fe-S protein